MEIVVPDYYEKFKCIAEKCKNSCCIGWEIDIDPETLEIYKNVGGKLGEKLKKSINFSAEPPHFITDEKERCPFLDQKGLCELISEFGEDALCQICYDHPRFREFFGDLEEIGLGICCEAAAELILNNKNKVNLIKLCEDEEKPILTEKEKQIFKKREELFSIFQNRNIPLKQKIKQTAENYKISPSAESTLSIINKYRNLERLDPKWDEFLNKADEKVLTPEELFEKAEEKIPIPCEQLLCYLTYRYFASNAKKGKSKNALNFILEATYFCLLICLFAFGELNEENFAETCRMFSLEVEYSEENINKILAI